MKEVQKNKPLPAPNNFGELVRITVNSSDKTLHWFSNQIEAERSAVTKWRSLGICPTSILYVKSLYVISELTGESIEEVIKRTHKALGISEWLKERGL